MHPVCSHDLPNQIVALQSLLQLFEWDEAARLSSEGREHFAHLQSIAGKTRSFVQYLKTLVRLHRHAFQPQAVTVEALLAAVISEAEKLFPQTTWSCESSGDGEPVWADDRLAQQGCAQLLVAHFAGAASGSATIRMRAAPAADRLGWTMELAPAEPAPASLTESVLLERRLALALALEFFARTDIVCRPSEGAAAGVSYTLAFAKRARHG